MTRLVLQPYRVALDNSVIWEKWQFFYNDSAQRFDSPPPWDSMTSLWMSRKVLVHIPRFMDQTGLSDARQLLLVGQIDSLGTYFRGIDTKSPAEDLSGPGDQLELEVAVHLPPGICSSRIIASTHIVLGGVNEHVTDVTVANRVGARLASSGGSSFNLDPLAPLFPTEAMAFDGVLPVGVPWLLNVAYEDLNDAFYGAVRLFINTSHPGGKAVLEGSESSSLLTAALKTDIVRSLFQQVAAKEGTLPPRQEFINDSIGRVLQNLSSNYFNSTADRVIKVLQTDPVEFDARLQSSLDYMKGI